MTDTPKTKGIYLLPNLFTTGALFSGFYAIIHSTHGNIEAAVIALFIGAFLDAMDGRVARLTGTTSEFGKQFDSLSDVITFGVASALVAYFWGLSELNKFGWLVAFLFAAATALRLARFNVQDVQDKVYFQGMPCPAAAMTLVANIWLMDDMGMSGSAGAVWWIWLLTIGCALAQVSTFRYKSFKDFNLRERIPFVWLIGIVLAVMFIGLRPPLVLSLIGLIYLASGPVISFYGYRRLTQRRKS